jgi:flagellar assembly protein FliH
VDQVRPEEQGPAVALSARPRALLRPTRFDPPVLGPGSGSRDVRDVHAEQLAAAMSVAREEGLRAARKQVDAALAAHEQARRGFEAAAAALMAAADQLRRHDADSIETVQQQAVMFGVSLAEELIGRELRGCDDTVLGTIERAVAFVPERGTVLLRVHPADAHVVNAENGTWERLRSRLEVVPDPAIERGGCVVAVGPLRIDAQLGPALARVQAVLGAS